MLIISLLLECFYKHLYKKVQRAVQNVHPGMYMYKHKNNINPNLPVNFVPLA